MKKLNQKGFTHLGLILICVVCAFTAGVGYYLLQQNIKQQNSTNNSSAPQTAKNPVSVGKSQIINLQKMGIRLTFPEQSPKLTFLETTSSDGSKELAFFSLSEEQTPSSCKLTDKGGMLGAIWKMPGKYPESPDENSGGVLAKQFPTYYLAFKKPGMPCTQDTKVNNEIEEAQKLITETLATSTEINQAK